MSRKTFLLILSLMTVALVGVILLQLYWLRSAVRLEQIEFDRKVNEALNEVSDKLEAREQYDFIRQKFSDDSLNHLYFLVDDLNRSSEQLGSAASGTFQASYRVPQEINLPPAPPVPPIVPAPPVPPASYTYSTYMENTEVSSDTTVATISFDSADGHMHFSERPYTVVRSNNTIHFKMPPFPSFNQMRTDSVVRTRSAKISNIIIHRSKSKNNSEAERLKKISSQATRLKTVIDKLVIELDSTNRPARQRIHPDSVKNYLDLALARQDIHLDYSCRTVENKNDSLAVIPATFKKDGYTASLFPHDLENRGSMLYLYFPEKESYLQKNMTAPYLWSILFTLVITGVFGSSIYVMLRQKKLSGIRNDFISNMTHEFKTPIATISLAVDAMTNAKNLSDSEKLQYYSAIIREENKRMHGQVEKVLQLALTDKENFIVNKEIADLHELVLSAIHKYDVLAREKDMTFLVSLKATDHYGEIDPFHLGNAIGNIIDNAIKYSPPGKTVEVETVSEEGNMTIAIRDQGIGMSRETQRKVFDKFYRAQSGNVHDVKGFGIGLSYAKNIIRAHGGSIELHSAPGKGTHFLFKLPLK